MSGYSGDSGFPYAGHAVEPHDHSHYGGQVAAALLLCAIFAGAGLALASCVRRDPPPVSRLLIDGADDVVLETQLTPGAGTADATC